jgi:hypothetical protein
MGGVMTEQVVALDKSKKELRTKGVTFVAITSPLIGLPLAVIGLKNLIEVGILANAVVPLLLGIFLVAEGVGVWFRKLWGLYLTYALLCIVIGSCIVLFFNGVRNNGQGSVGEIMVIAVMIMWWIYFKKRTELFK